MSLSKAEAFQFLKSATFGAIATVSRDGSPEAALVNIAATEDLELIFETIQTTRKCINLRRNPRVAIVAWRGDETLQCEGMADEPDEHARAPLLESYFARQPEALGHCGWPGLTYFRVRPHWIRLSRYGTTFSVRELRFTN